MDSNYLAAIFTDILKTSIANDWDEHEVSLLVYCLFTSNKQAPLKSKQMRTVLKSSKSFNAPVLSLLIEKKVISSNIIFRWVLELNFDKMIEILEKCFDEDAFTVLPEYSNNILVYIS
jgi:hypothetical protein